MIGGSLFASALSILSITTKSLSAPTLNRTAPVNTINDSQVLANQVLDSPSAYDFSILQNGTAANNGQFPMPSCDGFKLEEATIDQLQEAMSNGTLTSVKIVMCYLQRIFQTDEYIR